MSGGLVPKKVALVTGVGGLIGSYLVQTAPWFAPGWEVHGLTRQQVDLTDSKAVRRLWQQLKPQVVIHCAALSKVTACQVQPALASKVNVDVTADLANLTEEIPFIFFSSDQVFDGRKGHYEEHEKVNPINVYAETKVAAEQIVLANPRHTVIRTSLNGGLSPSGGRGFNEEIRRAWQANQTLRLFTDEFRCPIPAVVTARAVWELAALNQPGLYHLAGAERLSRWEIGKLLAVRWPDLHPKFDPGLVQEYLGAPRPPDLSLNCAKVQKLLSFPLPGLTQWLADNPEEPF